MASAECGNALLHDGQYHAAREFLAEAAEAEPANTQHRVALALAEFHDVGPETALTEPDKAPEGAKR